MPSATSQPRTGDGRYDTTPRPTLPPLQRRAVTGLDGWRVDASPKALHDAWAVLLAVAQDERIVIRSAGPGGTGECDAGSYDPLQRIIELAPAVTDPGLRILTLAHELGHALDPEFRGRNRRRIAQRSDHANRFVWLKARSEVVAHTAALRFCAATSIRVGPAARTYLAGWQAKTRGGGRSTAKRIRCAEEDLMRAAGRAAGRLRQAANHSV